MKSNKKTRTELEDAGFIRLERFPVKYYKVAEERAMIYEFVGMCFVDKQVRDELYLMKYDGEFDYVKGLLQEMRK